MKQKINKKQLRELGLYIASLIGIALVSILITNIVVGNKYEKQIEELNKQIESIEGNEEKAEIEDITDEDYNDRIKNSKGVEFEMQSELVQAGDTYRNDVAKGLKKTLDYLSDNNLYLATQVSEDGYDTYIYNKSGELFAEHSLYGTNTIRMSDGAQYILTDDGWTVSQDLDVISLMYHVADCIEKGTFELYKIDTSASEVKSYEGSMVLNGWQEVFDFYSVVDDAYAELLCRQLMASTNAYDVSVEFSYGFTEDNALTFSVYVIMPPEDDSGEPEILTNWSMNGYEIIDDWYLDSEWTSVFKDTEYDYKNLLNSTYEQLAKLLDISAVGENEVDAESKDNSEDTEIDEDTTE